MMFSLSATVEQYEELRESPIARSGEDADRDDERDRQYRRADPLLPAGPSDASHLRHEPLHIFTTARHALCARHGGAGAARRSIHRSFGHCTVFRISWA